MSFHEQFAQILSEEMSDSERIAQVAHQKWTNEWIANFFERIAHSLIFGQKTSDSLGNQMSEFPALIYSKKKKQMLSALSVLNKEYISVIEGTATAIVLQRYDSPNLSRSAVNCNTCQSDSAGGLVKSV